MILTVGALLSSESSRLWLDVKRHRHTLASDVGANGQMNPDRREALVAIISPAPTLTPGQEGPEYAILLAHPFIVTHRSVPHFPA